MWTGSYLHTWPLAIEEQFYTCWLLFLTLCLAVARVRQSTLVNGQAVGSFTIIGPAVA